MLMRTTTRRSAAVLMVALVAMLLVATGGSARAAQQRTTAGPGHAVVTPPAGRHAALTSPSHLDQPVLHLDITSTPPESGSSTQASGSIRVPASVISYADEGHLAPTGRAPPAL